MSLLPNFSIHLQGQMPVTACIGYAQAAEIAGLTGIRFPGCARGIFPTATACAMTTVRLQINPGVLNPFLCHPIMMAMEIGVLDEFSNGRASVSFGAGPLSALEKSSLGSNRRLAAICDTITIARALLRGEEVDYVGPVFSARKVRLDYKLRADIPILIAERGNSSVKLAGELADGILLSNMCSHTFAGRVADLLQSTRIHAGRPADARLVQCVPCFVNQRRGAAIAAAKRALGEMLPDFWHSGKTVSSAREGMLAGTGISEAEFDVAIARLLAGEDADRVLDERYITAFVLAGTPDECVIAAEKYADVGVSELSLTFGAANAAQDIQTIGAAVANRQRLDRLTVAGRQTPRLL